jgi:predicted ATPase
MLQRLYVHNFRCLQNFEIKPGENDSLLLIGKNGRGKSTIAKVLSIFKNLGTNTAHVGLLVTKDDFTLGRIKEQIHFGIDILLNDKKYTYVLILDMPENSGELRIVEESFFIDEKPVFERKEAFVTYHSNNQISEFSLDWHSAALSLITESGNGPIQQLKSWFQNMLILTPIPQQIGGESYNRGYSGPFADYLTQLLTEHPASYTTIKDFIKGLMPDFIDFNNKQVTSLSRMLEVTFGDNGTSYETKFDHLSDGEKCMFLGATILAAQKAINNLFVFWDEPDNYLAISEVENFISVLRQNFHNNNSQIWMTSHSSETINCFSHENTFVLRRKNHCSPVELCLINDIITSKESTIQKLRFDELD